MTAAPISFMKSGRKREKLRKRRLWKDLVISYEGKYR